MFHWLLFACPDEKPFVEEQLRGFSILSEKIVSQPSLLLKTGCFWGRDGRRAASGGGLHRIIHFPVFCVLKLLCHFFQFILYIYI